MNPCDPLLVTVVDGAGGQAVKVKIFGRTLAAKSARQIDIQAADAAYALNASELQFSLTQGADVSLAVRDVSKRHANVGAKGKRSHVVGAIRLQGGMDLELFSRVPFGDEAAPPLKFRPPDLGQEVPQRSANDPSAGRVEDPFRRGVESRATPAVIESEETFAHALKERVDEGSLLGAACSQNLLSLGRRRHPQRNRALLSLQRLLHIIIQR
jgi:hypothetical protein